MIADDVLLTNVNPATADDLPLLRRLERAAVAHVEEKTGRQWRLSSEEVIETVIRRGEIIPLSAAPEDGVLGSLESWDGTAWVAVDPGAYYVDGSRITLQQFPSSGTPYPTRFRVTYPGGYAQGDDFESIEVPENVKQAVLMYVTYWYDKRDGSDFDQLERAVSALLSPVTRATV